MHDLPANVMIGLFARKMSMLSPDWSEGPHSAIGDSELRALGDPSISPHHCVSAVANCSALGSAI
jgi:hypothetical protein